MTRMFQLAYALLGIISVTAAEPKGDRKYLREMVWNRQFDELEKIADSTRKKKAAAGQPYFSLYDFYNWTGPISQSNEDSNWQTHLTHLQAWQKAKPDSITPLIATACYWSSYGWKARGTDTADKTAAQQMKLFEARQQKADKALDQVPKSKRTEPALVLREARSRIGSRASESRNDRAVLPRTRVGPVRL